MARRPEDFEIDPVVVEILDGRDTSPAAMDAWLANLRSDAPVTLPVSASELVREIREHGET
jgi:hypothetical protein